MAEQKPIYLDYNGTTPHAPEVIEAMRPYFEVEFGNPSSSHWYGRRSKMAVNTAREQVAQILGCIPEEIIFTSGGTESNNHAIKCIAGSRMEKGNHIITSQIEHPAVIEVCRFLERNGFTVTYVPVGEDGVINVDDVLSSITPSTILISIMHANNEVGTLQPVAELSRLVKNKEILVHTDAAQSLGKVGVSVDDLGVDLLSIAGHKIYAPKGVGALYMRKSVSPEIFCHGACQERGIRAGTENVMGIVGLGAGCAFAAENLSANAAHMKTMRDRLESGLRRSVDDLRFNGHREKRLPNTASISFYGIDANKLLDDISSDVAASAGAACHADCVQISHVLEAMAVPRQWARGTVRFTTGRMTTAIEIDRAIEVVSAAVKKLRR